MTRISKVFSPNEEDAKTYDHIYKDAYLKLYPSLKPIYSQMKEVKKSPFTKEWAFYN